MPKKIDPEVRARAVRLAADHLGEYPSLTAAWAEVARQVGVAHETVRRWVLHSQVDGGQRGGVATEQPAEIRKLKAPFQRDDKGVGAQARVDEISAVDWTRFSPNRQWIESVFDALKGQFGLDTTAPELSMTSTQSSERSSPPSQPQSGTSDWSEHPETALSSSKTMQNHTSTA